VLYLGAVIVLHRGLEPILQTASLVHDLLPQRGTPRALRVEPPEVVTSPG
jgi:hypothetical protein